MAGSLHGKWGMMERARDEFPDRKAVGDQDGCEPAKRNMRRFALRVARALAIGYLLARVGAALFQERLIYFPQRELEATPADVGLGFENIHLPTSDGETIHAWYIPRDVARGTVLWSHGNGGNMSFDLAVAEALHRMGCNVLLYDYRGYGESTGSPGEQGTYRDAEAVWAYLTETRGESTSRIVIGGRSLGGAVAIELALRHRPAALVVECTFTSLTDVARLHYPLLPVSWILVHRYESVGKVGRIGCPKLFFHGRDDALIPLSMGRSLFDAAAESKEFIVTPGDHNEAGFLYSPEYRRKLDGFLDDVFSNRGAD